MTSDIQTKLDNTECDMIREMATALYPCSDHVYWYTSEIYDNTFVIHSSGLYEPIHWYMFCLMMLYPKLHSKRSDADSLQFADVDHYEVTHLTLFENTSGIVRYLYDQFVDLLQTQAHAK